MSRKACGRPDCRIERLAVTDTSLATAGAAGLELPRLDNPGRTRNLPMRRMLPVALLVLFLVSAVPAFAVTYLSAIADLPLPDGLAEQADKSTVFDAPLGRIITAYASGTVDADDVRDFYDDALPPLGWEKTGEGS